jgi:hypothetical protein
VHEEIGCRNKVDRHDNRNQQSSDDGSSERGVLFAAGLGTNGHGDHAEKGGERGHQDGAEAHPRSKGNRFLNRFTVVVQMAGELDDQNAVRNHDANHHDNTHEGHDVQCGPGSKEEQEHTCQSGGNREQNDEGIVPRRELRDQDQVHQYDGKNESDPKTLE